MDAVALTLPRLQTEEGFRAFCYLDSQGKRTIGYGFNVDAGISQPAAKALLYSQVLELQTQLLAYNWYEALDPVRQSVCLDIAFNGGINGLLAYPHMIAALAKGDWTTAAAECNVKQPELQSRYSALQRMILTGSI
jgi:lysozyme